MREERLPITIPHQQYLVTKELLTFNDPSMSIRQQHPAPCLKDFYEIATTIKWKLEMLFWMQTRFLNMFLILEIKVELIALNS